MEGAAELNQQEEHLERAVIRPLLELEQQEAHVREETVTTMVVEVVVDILEVVVEIQQVVQVETAVVVHRIREDLHLQAVRTDQVEIQAELHCRIIERVLRLVATATPQR
jgi:Fe-S cluster assembly scaffold protein SufB